ncbi:MAG: hypothetical protein ACKVI8_15425, partial [Paraglaciecola sp.]
TACDAGACLYFFNPHKFLSQRSIFYRISSVVQLKSAVIEYREKFLPMNNSAVDWLKRFEQC